MLFYYKFYYKRRNWNIINDLFKKENRKFSVLEKLLNSIFTYFLIRQAYVRKEVMTEFAKSLHPFT